MIYNHILLPRVHYLIGYKSFPTQFLFVNFGLVALQTLKRIVFRSVSLEKTFDANNADAVCRIKWMLLLLIQMILVLLP